MFPGGGEAWWHAAKERCHAGRCSGTVGHPFSSGGLATWWKAEHLGESGGSLARCCSARAASTPRAALSPASRAVAACSFSSSSSAPKCWAHPRVRDRMLGTLPRDESDYSVLAPEGRVRLQWAGPRGIVRISEGVSAGVLHTRGATCTAESCWSLLAPQVHSAERDSNSCWSLTTIMNDGPNHPGVWLTALPQACKWPEPARRNGSQPSAATRRSDVSHPRV